MKRLLIGTTVAAIAMFVWGFLYWGATPLPWTVIGPASDEKALSAALLEQLPASGAYVLPHPLAGDEEEALRRTQTGPLVTILYKHEGRNPIDPAIFGGGFVHMWLSAFLFGLLLRRVAPASTGGAVVTALLAAFALTLWANLGRPIWFAQPWDYHLLIFCYDFGGAAIAGAVLAPFARSE